MEEGACPLCNNTLVHLNKENNATKMFMFLRNVFHKYNQKIYFPVAFSLIFLNDVIHSIRRIFAPTCMDSKPRVTLSHICKTLQIHVKTSVMHYVSPAIV